MPSEASKQKRRLKRKAAKLKKRAAVARIESKGIAGTGRYRPTRLHGKGSYVGDAIRGVIDYQPKTDVGQGVSKAASALASAFNIPGAREIGSAAGWFTKLLGFGKYGIKRNTLMGRGDYSMKGGNTAPFQSSGMDTNSVPYFASSGTGSDCVFAHREYCFDVKSKTTFANTELPINPGNPLLFPWLSKMASMYEEYQFLGLVFEYKSTSATAVGTTSSAMGAVVMATDYDAYDSNYQTKRAMEAAEFSCSGAPFDTFMHPVECDPTRNNSKNFFVVPGMTTAASAQGDWRNSVLGNFSIATVGQQADDTVIGELWVTYHIKFSRPILEAEASSDDFAQHVSGQLSAAGAHTQLANVCTTSGFSITYSASSTAQKTISFQSIGTNLIKGQYLIVVMSRVWSANAFVNPTIPVTTLMGSASMVGHAINPSTGVLNSSSAYNSAASTTAGSAFPFSGGINIALAQFNAVGDGVTMWLPVNSVDTCYYDVYITAWNNGLAEPKPSLDDELATIREKLEKLEKGRCLIEEDANRASSSSSSSSSNSYTIVDRIVGRR